MAHVSEVRVHGFDELYLTMNGGVKKSGKQQKYSAIQKQKEIR